MIPFLLKLFIAPLLLGCFNVAIKKSPRQNCNCYSLNRRVKRPKNKSLDNFSKIKLSNAKFSRIGFAIARRLTQQGANVVVSSRKDSNVQRAVDELKQISPNTVIGVRCHVGHAKHRARLFEEALKHFGGIDCLISNAAVNPQVGPVLDYTESNWNRLFDVNVKAAWMLTKEAYPHLKNRGGGSIVFISSVAGYQPLSSLIGAYSVSKTTLLGLTKAVSQQVATENIRVNCVAPGIVQTKFSTVLYESEEAKEAMLSMIPMRKLAVPDDIAGTVAFLVSDDASYITGETICVTGGMASRL